MKTTVLLEHEPLPDGARMVRVLLRLEADPPPQQDRLPLNLSLVLDRSGSMHGGKLHAARAAAALLVRRLAPTDVVSVVAYDDEVQTIAPPATGTAQQRLAHEIERIESGGSTNLSGGWLRGRELVAQNLLERGVNRVILLTDGLANVGIIEPHRLTGLAAQGKAARVTTTTVGFGADYDELLLRALADAGGGNTYYIETTDQAASIFADELQGLLELGAQNVAVTVRTAPAAEITAVHHEYPRTASGDDLRLELGDIYAREPKPLLVELLVPGDVATATNVVELVVTGDVITASGDIEHVTITLPVTLTPGEEVRVDPEIRRELLFLAAAQARRDALALQEDGDYDGAYARLQSVSEQIRAAAPGDAELMAEADDIAALGAPGALYSRADAKYMRQQAYASSTGRRLKSHLIRRRREEEPPPA